MAMYQQKQGVTLYQDYEDWGVLFDGGSGEAVVVNAVGMVIWKKLRLPCVVEDLAFTVGEVFEDVPGNFLDDVDEYVISLCVNKIVISTKT